MEPAFGRGKVILLGEHSVVYGKPALAAGLGIGARATAESADGHHELHCMPWDQRVAPGDDEPLARAFEALLAHFGERPPVRVRCEVALPGGAGLGCSAAIGVAVLRALDARWREEGEPPPSDDEIAEIALRWEQVFHGNPSGVDNAMAACGGVAIFQRSQPLQRLCVPRPLPLVVAHSGESSSTKEVVDFVRKQYDKEPERIGEIFDGIEALVRNAKLAVEAGDLRGLGQLMDMNQALLSALLLSTEKLETLCRVARGAGALGAKLTGAGGGGCMIALAPSMEAATEIEAALREHATMTLVAEAGG